MNTRIQELALQAADYVNTYDDVGADVWFEMYNKKFAELIVKECMDVVADCKGTNKFEHWTAIKDHFGVES